MLEPTTQAMGYSINDRILTAVDYIPIPLTHVMIHPLVSLSSGIFATAAGSFQALDFYRARSTIVRLYTCRKEGRRRLTMWNSFRIYGREEVSRSMTDRVKRRKLYYSSTLGLHVFIPLEGLASVPSRRVIG